MNNNENTNIPEIAPTYRFQWEEAQDCFVVLYPEGMVKLSKSAGEILKRCDGNKSVTDIINDLSREFSGVDLSEDVLSFLTQAEDNGWIRTKSK